MYGGEIYYYRKNSLEVDCVLVLEDGRYALIEFKLGTKEIEKGAKNLIKVKNLIKNQIEKGETKIQEPSFLAVIYGGNMAYTLDNGVKVLPIGCLKD